MGVQVKRRHTITTKLRELCQEPEGPAISLYLDRVESSSILGVLDGLPKQQDEYTERALKKLYASISYQLLDLGNARGMKES